MTRDDVKKIILKSLGEKVRPEVLKKNMDGLIDEYLETQKFVEENGADPNELPTKDEIKWWFQEKLTKEEAEKLMEHDTDQIFEIQIDDIYLNTDLNKTLKRDHLAVAVFKRLYNFNFSSGSKLPVELKHILKLHHIALTTKTDSIHKQITKRLADIALLGAIRLYKLERRPYLSAEQMKKIISHFRISIDVIYKIQNGFYGDSEIMGSIMIFDGLEKYKIEDKKDIDNIGKEKKRKPRKKKPSHGPD